MKRQAALGIMLSLFLAATLASGLYIKPAKASGTIYIRTDGRVDPPRAPIRREGNSYTFADNVYESIVVQRSNIIIDGAGYTLSGSRAYTRGIDLAAMNNVTIMNLVVKGFYYGIYLGSSSTNTILGNCITDNEYGIRLELYSSGNSIFMNNIAANTGGGVSLIDSSDNRIFRNHITANRWEGIVLIHSSKNSITQNNVTNNGDGVILVYSIINTIFGNEIATNSEVGLHIDESSSNFIFGNNITANRNGIYLLGSLSNLVYHNNFLNNEFQVYDPSWFRPDLFRPSINVWGDSYPSGGNYWSDYEERYPDAKELDGSGLWDTPYVIDENNQDDYPLMEPWTAIQINIGRLKAKIAELSIESQIDNQGIVQTLISKLNTAQKLIEKGKIDEAKTILGDFVTQVQELSGIHISVEAADILIKSAEYIISHW